MPNSKKLMNLDFETESAEGALLKILQLVEILLTLCSGAMSKNELERLLSLFEI